MSVNWKKIAQITKSREEAKNKALDERYFKYANKEGFYKTPMTFENFEFCEKLDKLFCLNK